MSELNDAFRNVSPYATLCWKHCDLWIGLKSIEPRDITVNYPLVFRSWSVRHLANYSKWVKPSVTIQDKMISKIPSAGGTRQVREQLRREMISGPCNWTSSSIDHHVSHTPLQQIHTEVSSSRKALYKCRFSLKNWRRVPTWNVAFPYIQKQGTADTGLHKKIQWVS